MNSADYNGTIIGLGFHSGESMISITLTMDGYEIEGPDRTESLLNDLLISIADGGHKLSPEERLAIVERHSARAAIGDRRYASLLHDAGCFADAAALFDTIGHWRKVGDCRLAAGDLAGALACYSKPDNAAGEQAYRGGPDYDRLLGIAFRASDWDAVIEWIRRGEPDVCSFDAGQVIFANSSRAKGPLLKFLIIAGIRSGRIEAVQREFASAFGCEDHEWKALVSGGTISDEKLAKEQAKTFPRALKKRVVSIAQGVEIGSTDRALMLSNWLGDVGRQFEEMKARLATFLETGDEAQLRTVLGWLTAPDSYEVLQSAFFALMNGTMLHTSPSPHALAVYRSHPSITRAGMREYLGSLLRTGERLSPADLYICALQFLTFDQHADPLAPSDAEDLLKSRVMRAPDWAEAKLAQWMSEPEAGRLLGRLWAAVAEIGPWKDVRQLREWSEFMGSVTAYLGAAWIDEIGATWQGEEITFQTIRDALPRIEVHRHARPFWLSPQHLDIFIPARKLAVEFMGEQHYAAIDYFGGLDALTRTRERDQRKARLCADAGIRLEYIRFDEDIAERVKVILDLY